MSRHRSPVHGSVMAYGLAPMAVLAASLFAYAATFFMPHANLSLVFLFAVLVVAARTGLGPAMVASVLSFLVFNYFFIYPHFTLQVQDDGDVATLVFFLLVAAVAGNLAARMHREMEKSRTAVERMSSLYDFGRHMSVAADAAQVTGTLANRLGELRSTGVVVYGRDGEGGLSILSSFGTPAVLESAVVERVWSADDEGTPAATKAWEFRHLDASRGRLALVAINDRVAEEGIRDLTDSFCHQAALALDRVLLVNDLSQARISSETEQLRSALLSSVSHDLRTPLASIIGATTSLHEYGEHFTPEDRQELLATALVEARRLDRYIQNLLDMTRLGHGPLHLKRDWVDVGDLVSSAVARLRRTVDAAAAVEVRIGPDVPPVWVHGALIEQALFNLLDNALRFSDPGVPVTVAARRDGHAVFMEVCDRGPGIPVEQRERVFEMFHSAAGTGGETRRGTGLGLAICRGMVAAHGGTVTAGEGPDGQGTCIVIRLPAVEPAG